jgi:hypothetical protein
MKLSMGMVSCEEQRRFESLYDAHRLSVLAYCIRRVSAADASDACSETFLVAWRRIDAVPLTRRAGRSEGVRAQAARQDGMGCGHVGQPHDQAVRAESLRGVRAARPSARRGWDGVIVRGASRTGCEHRQRVEWLENQDRTGRQGLLTYCSDQPLAEARAFSNALPHVGGAPGDVETGVYLDYQFADGTGNTTSIVFEPAF